MNKTSDILTKQYIKLCNERDLLTKECDDLPVGSIQQKKIKNGVYFYRQYREGTTVKTVFVPGDQLTEVSKSIKRRKEIEKRLKEINTEISQLIKALGLKFMAYQSLEIISRLRMLTIRTIQCICRIWLMR